MTDRFDVKGDCTVEGTFVGRLLLGGLIRIGPCGRVRARIMARDVVVEGSVIGSISAENTIRLFPTARVWGDLQTPELYVHEGVVFSGACTIVPEEGVDVPRLINELFDR